MVSYHGYSYHGYHHVSLSACPIKTHIYNIAIVSEARPGSTKMLWIPLLDLLIFTRGATVFSETFPKFVINIHILLKYIGLLR